MKALDVSEITGSSYPSPFDEPCAERSNKGLSHVFGLKDFGVNLTTLPPGTWSSQRHWHSEEDEFIYVLEGSPTLITDEGEQDLEPGDIAGFPASHANGHHLVNRSESPVKFLVVGGRKADDDAFYPDIDMSRRGRGSTYCRKNGDPYEK
ncbi:MAG TPA: transcriptional regulator [Gammaproteobacteria bacterium]|nr:transcriptional regulator [Gammaproteobacteria bacterium]|tara:strand:- start:180 stop:629 length:450 start_codon:yes stop_codon:yes gene_type:complete